MVSYNIGSRAKVMHGKAKQTSGGLRKKDLKYNNRGKIVSRKASYRAKKNNNLVKAGFITKKGIFGVIKKGGVSANQLPPLERGQLSSSEILDNFYLCSQVRHDKPIIDNLVPFGSFAELDNKYKNETNALKYIKNKKINIKNAKIVGQSMYGVYFRFVRKRHLGIKNNFYSNNVKYLSNKKYINRSFIFDIMKLLTYIKKFQTTIPLCWFAGYDAYGYESGPDTFLFNNDIDHFLSNVGSILEEKLYNHEFVCRIPIPLIDDSYGFLGVSPISILGLKNKKYNRRQKYKIKIGDKVKLNMNKLNRKRYNNFKNNIYKVIKETNTSYQLLGFGSMDKNKVILYSKETPINNSKGEPLPNNKIKWMWNENYKQGKNKTRQLEKFFK